jgi:hypothetical protein
MNVIGEVEGRICILVDYIIDSGGTIVNAADALLEQGATEVYAYITHGVLSGGAVARITGSRLKELVITDSILPTAAVKGAHNVRLLSLATLIGEADGRTYSITLSAMASRTGGTVTPSVLAVRRLMTISNLVGCSTGRSAGFSPLRMRPTYMPVWR